VHLGGAQLITFDIAGGGVPRITPATDLPPPVGPTAIDGSTQPSGWVEVVGPNPDANGIEMREKGKKGPAKKAIRKALKAIAAAEKALLSKRVAETLPADVHGQLAAEPVELEIGLRTLTRAPAP
jgi:hypothetical protein